MKEAFDMRKILLALGLSAFVFIVVPNCHTPKFDAEGIPKPVVNAEDNPSFCNAGCANLRRLKCPEGEDLIYPLACDSNDQCHSGLFCKLGSCRETCETLCEDIIGRGRKLAPKCWSEISECSEIEDC